MVGEATGISYEADFNSYKAYLKSNRKKAPVRKLFKLWDEYLFTSAQKPLHKGGIDSSLDDHELEAMLDEESSEEEPGEDVDDA